MRQAAAISPRDPKLSQGETVIIVDPDTALLRALRFDLELEGFEVQTHRSGRSLDRASLPTSRACLVIEDNLPGGAGIGLLRRMRSAGVGLPAIILTSHPAEWLAARTQSLEAIMLEKPLPGGALTVAVRDALHRNDPPLRTAT